MRNLNLPKELVSKCYQILELTHQNNLSKIITSREYMHMVILALVPEGIQMMNYGDSIFKIRKLIWLLGIIILILAVLFSYWLLLALLIILIADRYFAKKDKDNWKFLASILLSIEFLINNFAGWGDAFPKEKENALQIVKEISRLDKFYWMDYILPNHTNLGPDDLKMFGPEY